MAREYAIPSTSTFLQDYGLTITPAPTARNRRIVILGTAEDGPLYEPVIVDNVQDAQIVWGRSSTGDLVKGLFETWFPQGGNQNVVGVRIGNAKEAILEIVEKTGSGIDKEQPNTQVSLRLKSRYPGSVYNQVTLTKGADKSISIYNPKTAQSSSFVWDDKTTVRDLVNVINNDRNLSSIIVAEFEELEADFEAKVVKSANPSNTSSWFKETSTYQEIDLKALCDGTATITSTGIQVNDKSFLVSSNKLPYALPATVTENADFSTIANDLIELDYVETMSVSAEEKKFVGVETTTELSVLDGKSDNKFNTLRAIEDYSSDGLFISGPDETGVTSEIVYKMSNILVDESPSIEGSTFRLTVPAPLDDTVETDSYITADFITSLGSVYTGYTPSTIGVGSASSSVKTILGENAGKIVIEYTTDISNGGTWNNVPYGDNGLVIESYTPVNEISGVMGYVTFGVGAGIVDASDITPELTPFLEFDTTVKIKKDIYFRVSANTIKVPMTEVTTNTALENVAGVSPSAYFVVGNTIKFNRAPMYPVVMNIGTRVQYEVGTNVIISDATTGKIRFTDRATFPLVGVEATARIRFVYKYLPNFPNITGSRSMMGGSNGTKMTVKQREAELRKAYENIRNFEADIYVPMSAYVDDIKDDFSPETGLIVKTPNSYINDISEFLDELSINSYQPVAVFSVKPSEGTSQKDMNDWVEKLVEFDSSDTLRGANIALGINNKHINITAFEPVFNFGTGAYFGLGNTAYAAVLASTPYNTSPTNKGIPGITAVKHKFSIGQLEALNGMRYVTMKTSNSKTPVIVNDITFAPYGSDYVNWTTFSIAKEAADQVKMVADIYIGKPNSPEVRNALEQDISNVLRSLSGVSAFDFTLHSSLDQQVLGVVEIDLILVPIFTLKKIRTTLKLRKSVSI